MERVLNINWCTGNNRQETVKVSLGDVFNPHDEIDATRKAVIESTALNRKEEFPKNCNPVILFHVHFSH